MTDENGITHLYRHYDAEGNLLYVGISLSAINRLSQHKMHSHWFLKIANVKIEQFNTREEALIAETNAIATENPLHNIRKKNNPKTKNENTKTRYQESRDDLIDRIVNFRATYSVDEVAGILEVSRYKCIELIESKKIGSVIISDHIKNTRYGPRRFVKYIITGWQLIEFLELAEKRGSINLQPQTAIMRAYATA